jgi:hypothetical protein
MNQPMGRVVALQYRNVARQPGGHPTVPVLRVYLRTHTDEIEHHDLLNGSYTAQNAALQFMALHGFRPSELDSYTNVEDDQLLVPIAPMPEAESWGLARTALAGGEQALTDAEWFEGLDTDGDDESPSAPAGGGSPDPGTGNRGGVEDPSDPDIDAEVADEDSDAGVEVTVE